GRSVTDELEPEIDPPEGDRIAGLEHTDRDTFAVDAGAVGAVEIAELYAVGPGRQLRVPPADRGVIDRDVARSTPAQHERSAGWKVKRAGALLGSQAIGWH